MKRALTCLVMLLGLLTVLPVAAADPVSTHLVSAMPGFHGVARTDGEYVAWQYREAAPSRFPRIFAASVRPTPSTPVDLGPGGLFAIGNGTVVWLTSQNPQCPTCPVDVGARSLVTGGEVVAGRTTVQHNPAVSTNRVVWFSIEDDRRALWLRDINTMAEPVAIAEIPADMVVRGIAMDGNRVLWREEATDALPRMRLRTLELGGAAATVVDSVLLLGEQYDVSGDLIAYTFIAGRSPNIRVVNTRTGAESIVASGNVDNVTLDGRYVFWTEHRELRNPALLPALRAYDLATDSAFDLPLSGRNGAPHARGGTLVWVRSEQTSNVYTAQLRALLPNAPRPAPETASADVRYFGETAHNLGFAFKAFWEGSGGLPVFGYPLTDEFDEKNRDTSTFYTVQYFERQRYEYHPENRGTPYEVLLGRLGVEELGRSGRDWRQFPKAQPEAPHYFAQTGHAIAPEFWGYWRSHGLEFGDRGVTEREALALFGYPISEPQLETNSSGDRVLTQWFERARFEYHPNNPAPYTVLLGRLSADLLEQRGW